MILAPDEKPIYWASFLVRSGLGLAAWWASQFLQIGLIDDAMLYERMGARIAFEWYEHGTSQTLTILMAEGRHAWLMFFVMGALSFLLGGTRALPLLVLLFNLVTAWVPVVTYRMAKELGISAASARSATYLVMFSPVFAFWGGALYKEGLVQLALALIVLARGEAAKEFPSPLPHRARDIAVRALGTPLLHERPDRTCGRRRSRAGSDAFASRRPTSERRHSSTLAPVRDRRCGGHNLGDVRIPRALGCALAARYVGSVFAAAIVP